MRTEHIVLRLEHALDTTHQAATLTVQVREHLLLERRLVDVARTDGNANRHSLLEGPARHVLEHGHRRVDATALLKQRAHRAARALRRTQNHVDILGRHDMRLVLVHDRETVRKVQRLAGSDILLQVRPRRRLRSIRQQVHENRALRRSLLNRKQVLARHPAVRLGLAPRLAVLAHTDNHVQAIVTQVQTLAVALRAIAQQCKRFILKVVLQLLERPVLTLVHLLRRAGKVERLHATHLHRHARHGRRRRHTWRSTRRERHHAGRHTAGGLGNSAQRSTGQGSTHGMDATESRPCGGRKRRWAPAETTAERRVTRLMRAS